MILGFSTISLFTLMLIFFGWLSVMLLIIYGILCFVLYPVRHFILIIKGIIDKV